jgi:hypothetical protein
MHEIGTRSNFIRACNTYLLGSSKDKLGMGANFILSVLQIERKV